MPVPAGPIENVISWPLICFRYCTWRGVRLPRFEDPLACAAGCASCGACRDCGLCETICPQNAISRQDLGEGAYEYTVDAELCIGCGFCAGACPCGIWRLIENDPLE